MEELRQLDEAARALASAWRNAPFLGYAGALTTVGYTTPEAYDRILYASKRFYEARTAAMKRAFL